MRAQLVAALLLTLAGWSFIFWICVTAVGVEGVRALLAGEPVNRQEVVGWR